MVLEAAVRSWPPVEPICMRWKFPVWTRDDSLDPAALRLDWPKRRKKEKKEAAKPAEAEWTPERFVESFIMAEPRVQATIFDQAKQAGISNRKARSLLKWAEDRGIVHRWKYAPQRPVQFATTPQTEDAQ